MIPKIVDIICDNFESSLRRGEVPSVEDLLQSVEEQHRAQLLYELLALEVEHKIKRGHVVYLDELRNRFPREPEVLQRLFRSFLWEGSGFAAVGGADLMLRQFRLKAIVGRGSFGTVWLADDTRLDREVAIKTPHAYEGQEQNGLKTALSEAGAVAKLRHPNILPVHEVAEVNDHWFMVTDFAAGGTLQQFIKTRQFQVSDVTRIGLQLAEALDCAHAHGVHHRDLKPSNILLDENGRPLIADFGLALLHRHAQDAEGVVCGTPSYMAPEQAAGRVGGERADIYSLGMILGNLLEHASNSPESGQRLRGVRTGGRPSEKLLRQSLTRIREKCSHLDPVQRYASASALAADLKRVAGGRPPREVPTPARERLGWALSGRWVAMALILCGATGLAAAVALSSRVQPHPDARLVRISTAPDRCQITLIPLDPITGDPLPDRLQKAEGLSPVEMHLIPGDYLVVAVQNETVFNEVTRHVPPQSETIAFAGRQTSWRLKDGLIELPSIDVRPFAPRRPLINVAETTELLISPPNAPADYGEQIRVPPFLVATTCIDRATWMRNNGDTEDSPRVKKFLFNLWLARELVESDGMRLPSAAEYSALLAQESELEQAGVVGLGDDVAEWTSSRAGAHGTGQPHAAAVNERTDQVLVMGLGGEFVENSAGERVLRPAIQMRHQRRADLASAWRPVRSLKPRVTAEDFTQSVPLVPRRTPPAP